MSTGSSRAQAGGPADHRIAAEPVVIGGTPGDPRFSSGPPGRAAPGPPALPDPLRARLGRARWEQVWVKAGSEVWRACTERSAAYLKIGPADSADGTGAEHDRLVWLDGRLGAPRPLAHHVEGSTGWLLTSEVAGTPAHHPRLRMGSVAPLAEALGRSLRRWHDELPVGACPFDARLDVLLASAERRVAAGGVDPSLLGATYRRRTAEELLAHLLATRPEELAEDRVVGHGDPGLPNLLVSDDDPTDGGPGGQPAVVGVVDVGRLGVSDRYRDLAISVRSLGMNTGPEVAYLLLDAYGITNPDLARLEYYVLLDDMW